VPAQLTTAKAIFLANAGSNVGNTQFATVAYNGMYQNLDVWNHYHLASAPADADLSFEVSVVSLYEGQYNTTYFVQLVIRDARTQALLLTISENIGAAGKEKTFEKNIADSTAKLVADLKTLTSNQAVTPQPAIAAPKSPATTPAKTRIQQNN
jgi:hypothetical protein